MKNYFRRVKCIWFPIVIIFIMGILAGVIVVIDGNYIGLIYIFIVYSLISILLFLARKFLFSKIQFTNDSISIVYKKSIVKTIVFKDMRKIEIIGKDTICFSDTFIYRESESWKNTKQNIVFRIDNASCSVLLNYLDKFPVEVKNINTLSKKFLNRIKM